ncbi:hypothetical protein BpHYR1_023970 [Brachionus plicatilis]|uniref:Uncharacterized protein n=1 Tax=Brachionus plicatilis TaxID=10195 RepID=A0A3M7Q3C3_BRAPC|nr:hypothetical protein BpHYR1_023970 [Brachionus plicatilis]
MTRNELTSNITKFNLSRFAFEDKIPTGETYSVDDILSIVNNEDGISVNNENILTSLIDRIDKTFEKIKLKNQSAIF